MNILTDILARPDRLETLSVAQWNDLIRLARYNKLLGTIAHLSKDHGFRDRLPAELEQIFVSETVRSQHLALQANQELRHLNKLFKNKSYPVVLLKGAAYLASNLAIAKGRRLSDVDILVPKNHLEDAELALLNSGWRFKKNLSDYDNNYYRQLSHELPPMHHTSRGMELDVHHNLCSPISRIVIPSSKLIERISPIPDSCLYTLSDQDMLLHSAVHLFFNDELRGGIRDLYDMHCICTRIIKSEQDLVTLISRAVDLQLDRPLYYALSALVRIFNTPFPDGVEEKLKGIRPQKAIAIFMNQLIDLTIAPKQLSMPSSHIAQHLLLLRAHWVRMPPMTLLRHLSIKLQLKLK